MKKQRKKRVVAFLMSVLMILSLIQNVSYTPYANETDVVYDVTDTVTTQTDAVSSDIDSLTGDENFIEDLGSVAEEPTALPFMEIVDKINISPTSSASTPVDMSQQFTVKLEFDLPEDSKVDLSTNYIYYFDLKEVAVENNVGESVNALVAASSTQEPQPIVMGNVKVGTYTIENGYVKLNFYEGLSTLVGDKDASRHGEFTFNCGLDEEKLSDDGGTYTLKFSTKAGVVNPTVTVNPKDTIDAGIDVAKSEATFNEETMTAEYKITVTNNNNTIVNNVVIKDSMGKYLSLNEGSIKTNNGVTVTPTKENAWSNSWNFSIVDLPSGTTEITYSCAVDESVMIGANNALGNSNGLDNTVSAKVGDRDIYIDADTDSKTQTTKFNVYKDVVSKNTSVSGDTITWTIVINAGSTELDLNGYTFTDTLDSKLTYDAGSVKVTSTVENDPNVAGLKAAIEGLDTGNAISYPFAAGSTGEYTITYTTTVPKHAGVVSYTNTAEVTNKDGEVDRAPSTTPGIGSRISSKTYDGSDNHSDKNDIPDSMIDANGDLILDWKSTVYIPQGATTFTYYDYVKDEIWNNGLGFVDGSLVVTAKTDAGNELTLEAGLDKDYTVQYSTNGNMYEMTVVLTSTGIAKVNQDGNTAVYLDYQTIGRYHDRTAQDWQYYVNKYSVTVDSITEDGEAKVEKYYQESKGSGGISKTAAVVDEDAHTITWQVTVDPGKNNTFTNLKLVDTVTDMFYSGYSGEGYTYEYDPEAGNTKMVALIRTTNYAIYEIPMTQTLVEGADTGHPKYTYTIDFSDNNALTQLSGYSGLENSASLDQKIDIFYTTKITGDYLYYNNYDTPYTNKVVATQKPADTELKVGESTVTKTMDTEILTKECITEDGQPTSMLQYTINVNPDALNLNPDPNANYFVIEDDLPESLVFMTDGTTITDDKGNVYSYVSSAQQVKDAPLGSHVYHVSYENSVLMFTVPDEAALSITYTVNMLMDSTSGSKQYINSVKLEEPYVANRSNDSSDINRRISSSSATIYSVLFRVEKINSQDITQRLGKATFTLEEYAYIDGTGWSTTPTNTYTATTVAGQLLKDTDFDDANGNHPKVNCIYLLYESEAPYGYEKTDLKYKFIVLDDNEQGTWANRLNGMDDVYRIMGNSTFVFPNTPSTNVIPNKLTITKEYYQADGLAVANLPTESAQIQIFNKALDLSACQSGSYTPISTGSISADFVYTEVYNSVDGHIITLENIPDGTYTVYEKKSPDGYDILDRVYNFVVENGKIKWEADEETYQASATIKNKETYDNSITIKKNYYKASDTSKTSPLVSIPEKAVFICTNINTNQTVEVENVQGKEGFEYVINKLPEGSYLLEEAESSVYTTDSLLPYTINVSSIGNIQIKDKNGKTVDITLVNKDAEVIIDNIINDNSITIHKKYYDEDGNQITDTSGFKTATGQQKVDFKLYKEDGTGNYVLVSAGDGLYESYSDTAADTNCEDSYTWNNLEPGKYKIVESLKTGDTTKYEPVADTVFVVGSDYKITVTNGSSNTYDAEVNVNNKILSGTACRFYLVKQFSDQNGNLSVAGSTDVDFKLTDANGNVVTGSESALVYNTLTQRWESTNLQDGTYTLEEIATKDGYVIAGKLTFTITSGQIVPTSINYSGDADDYSYVTERTGNIETIVFTLINRPKENSVKITKKYYQPDVTSEVINIPDPGAQFTLYSVDGGNETEIEKISNTSTYVFDKFEPGDYIIRETNVPAGYIEANPVSFTVADNYEVKITSVTGTKSQVAVIGTDTGYAIELEASNVLTNKFVITKQFTNVAGTLISGTDRETLFNATTFVLYDSNNVPVGAPQFSQSANAVTLTNLNNGKYTLKEDVSPEGFKKADDIEVVVSDGKITATYTGISKSDFTDLYNNGTYSGSATLYNRQSTNTLVIKKYYADADGNNLELSEVSNKASFVVKDATGNIVTNYTFNPNGGTYTFKNLLPGDYTISETEPVGFEEISDYSFVVDLNGKITFDASVPGGWTVTADGTISASVDVFNKMLPNTLKLHKVYVDKDGNVMNVTVTDSMKQMFTLNGVNGARKLEYDDSTGSYYIDNIMPGTYELIEEVPLGYMPVTGKITVVVALNGTITASYSGNSNDFRITGSGTRESADIEFKNHEVTNVITVNKSYVTYTGASIDIDELQDSEKADFKLYQIFGSSNRVEVTDDEIVKKNSDTGKYAFVNLSAGYYEIEEVVGKGFEDNTSVISFRVDADKKIVSVTGADETDNSTDFDKRFNVVNERKPFDNKLLLNKEFINQGGQNVSVTEFADLLSEVEFKMYDSNDNEMTGFVFDSAINSWVVEHLEPGEYTIKEISYPDAYVPAGNIKVTVTKTASEETEIIALYEGNIPEDMVVTQDANNKSYIELAVKNHQKVDNYFAIDKKYMDAFGDEITGEVKDDLIANTEFTYRPANSSTEIPIPYDVNSKLYVLEDLQTGAYIVTETAPQDFIAVAQIELHVAADGSISVVYGGDATDISVDMSTVDNATTVTVNNYYKSMNVNIGKYDIVSGNELPGANLSITDEDGNVIDEWTSSTGVHKISVDVFEAGEEYTLTEITAPFGYEIAESITFKLDIYGNVYILADDGTFKLADANTIVMQDAHKYVNISKVDITNDEELPGAKLTVKDDAGNVIDEWVSSTEKHPISMSLFEPNKEYTLIEITAPKGYEVAESIVFKMDEAGNIYIKDENGEFVKLTSESIVMKDAPVAEEEPPVDTPTTEVPPVDTPTTEVPPVDTPTTEVPPVDIPTTEVPPVDTPPTEAPPTDTSSSVIVDSPDTGDNMSVMVIVIMMMSVFGMVVFKKKKKYNF